MKLYKASSVRFYIQDDDLDWWLTPPDSNLYECVRSTQSFIDVENGRTPEDKYPVHRIANLYGIRKIVYNRDVALGILSGRFNDS